MLVVPPPLVVPTPPLSPILSPLVPHLLLPLLQWCLQIGLYCGLTVLLRIPFFCTPGNCVLTISSQVEAWFLANSSSCVAAWTSAQVGPIWLSEWSSMRTPRLVGVEQCENTPTPSVLSHSSLESIAELFVSLLVSLDMPLTFWGMVALKGWVVYQ